MMKYLYFTIISLIVFTSCQTISNNEIRGLWQLQSVEVDIVPKKFTPTYLSFTETGTFAASMVNGDITGVYSLNDNVITYKSEDQDWFIGGWMIKRLGDVLELKGKNRNGLNTVLRFDKIEELPSDLPFLAQLEGDWRLYRTRTKKGKFSDANAELTIDPAGWFELTSEETGINEKGDLVVDARHRKLIFEREQTEWRIWFYGRELRLTEVNSGMEYSLRRPD